MIAIGLSLGLYLYWVLIGYAVLSVLHSQRNLLQNMLLAPVVGLTTILLPIFWLNHAGLPVRQFAVPLAALVLLASAWVLLRRRPVLPFRHYLPFAGWLLLALLLTGRPMLEFGFDWLSHSNDDMANYVLGSARMMDYGAFHIPTEEDLVGGRDYTHAYMFFNLGIRHGSELLSAWVASMAGLTPDKTFMPLMLALHLALISTASALVCQSRKYRFATLLSGGLLATSALTSLGTLYQLIAQVSGLSLLAGCAVVLFRPFERTTARNAKKYGLLVAMLVSTLFVVYPEVMPFLALSFVAYVMVGFRHWSRSFRSLLAALGIAVPAGLLFLNSYAVHAALFLRHQASYGMGEADAQMILYPFYLLPSGLASLWGFQAIASVPPAEPWLSGGIALGGLLLIGTAWAAIWQAKKSNLPSAIFTVVMLLLAVRLFTQRSDFGLFKLAMFITPFAIGVIAVTCSDLIRRPVVRVIPLVLLAVAGLFTQNYYVDQSRGQTYGGLTEIPAASQSRINDELRQLLAATGRGPVVLDTTNIVITKFQLLYLRGREAAFPGQDMFATMINASPSLRALHPDISIAETVLRDAMNGRFLVGAFNTFDKDNADSTNRFLIDTRQPPVLKPETVHLLANTPKQSVVNRRQLGPLDQQNFVAVPWSQVRDHLIFISSQLGKIYYLASPTYTSLYQLESDFFYPKKSIAGAGRNLLFQVINPTGSTRLVLDLTASLKSDGENQLPPASAIGAERHPFPVVGRGSARVFSAPLTPQVIQGRPYVAIDMGTDGTRFPVLRTGLMQLYGTDIPTDRRRLVGYLRDISLLSEDDYANLTPPASISSFPSDLANPNLEYSGLYEDGWVADAAFLKLTRPAPTAPLVVRGMIPGDANTSVTTELRLIVDGQEVTRRDLRSGEFELKTEPSIAEGTHRIDLQFSDLQRLAHPDNRPVAAQLRFVGFERAY